MAINRRRLLQYTGVSCALGLLPASSGAYPSLRAYEVRDAVALPRFAPGDRVVADTSTTGYTGTGLYLYPAWGQPRLYEVQARANRLEFRNPGSGQLLWTQSASLDSTFAGRVIEHPDSSTAVLAGVPDLSVPQRRLPA